jgi:Family of unknown function (DUF6200)
MEKHVAPSLVEGESKHQPAATNGVAPVIVDLGSAKKKQIKDLAKGQGKLTQRVLGVIDELKSDGTLNGSAQPVIVIVKKKAGRKNLLGRFL